MLIIETTLIHVLGCTYASFSGIYIIYMGSCRATSNNIPASTSVFHVLGRIPRAPRRALGIRHRTKNLGLGAILLYIALGDPIYTLHIYKHNFPILYSV